MVVLCFCIFFVIFFCKCYLCYFFCILFIYNEYGCELGEGGGEGLRGWEIGGIAIRSYG